MIYCYNMDEPWKRYSNWKKLDPKGHILYDSESEKWKSLRRVRLFVTPCTIQSMEFSRPE